VPLLFATMERECCSGDEMEETELAVALARFLASRRDIQRLTLNALGAASIARRSGGGKGH